MDYFEVGGIIVTAIIIPAVTGLLKGHFSILTRLTASETNAENQKETFTKALSSIKIELQKLEDKDTELVAVDNAQNLKTAKLESNLEAHDKEFKLTIDNLNKSLDSLTASVKETHTALDNRLTRQQNSFEDRFQKFETRIFQTFESMGKIRKNGGP